MQEEGFFFENHKKEERIILSVTQNHLCNLPPKYSRSLEYLGTTVILFSKVRQQPSYIYALTYLNSLDLNFTLFKKYYYFIQSLFLKSSLQYMPFISAYTKSPIVQSCVIRLAFYWTLSMPTFRYFPAVITPQCTTDARLNIMYLTKKY